jgi:hypothetical protein
MSTQTEKIAVVLGAMVDEVLVVSDLREINELDPAYKGLLQMVRKSIEPAETKGAYWISFELWACIPSIDLETLELPLVELVDDHVIPALEAATWLTWSTAERDVHPVSGMPAYRIEIRTRSNPTP